MKLKPLQDRIIIERVESQSKTASAEIKFDGKELLIVKESDIIAIL